MIRNPARQLLDEYVAALERLERVALDTVTHIRMASRDDPPGSARSAAYLIFHLRDRLDDALKSATRLLVPSADLLEVFVRDSRFGPDGYDVSESNYCYLARGLVGYFYGQLVTDEFTADWFAQYRTEDERVRASVPLLESLFRTGEPEWYHQAVGSISRETVQRLYAGIKTEIQISIETVEARFIAAAGGTKLTVLPWSEQGRATARASRDARAAGTATPKWLTAVDRYLAMLAEFEAANAHGKLTKAEFARQKGERENSMRRFLKIAQDRRKSVKRKA